MSAQTIERPAHPAGAPEQQPAACCAQPIQCSECGEDFPATCPDLCGTLGGTIPSGPPARRTQPILVIRAGAAA